MATHDGTPFCPQCGYDLRGQSISRCPECGLLYDEEALDQGTREVFYSCLDSHLRCITPLLLSAVLSVMRISAKLTLGIPCLGIGLLLLVPVISIALRNRIKEGKSAHRRRTSSQWNVEDIALPGTVAAAFVSVGLRLSFAFAGFAVVLAGVLLVFGLWRLYQGSSRWSALKSTHQDRSMPARRALMLERANGLCWTLWFSVAMIWLVAMGQVLI